MTMHEKNLVGYSIIGDQEASATALLAFGLGDELIPQSIGKFKLKKSSAYASDDDKEKSENKTVDLEVELCTDNSICK